MSIGIFTKREHQPTDAEMRRAVGPKLAHWESLLLVIQEQYAVRKDIKFMYGDKYGWALRFRIRERLFTSFYPTQSGFTVQVILRPEAINRAHQMKLGKSVQQVIARAHPYPEGRWLFVPVKSAKDVQDVQQLLALRVECMASPKKPTIRRRSGSQDTQRA